MMTVVVWLGFISLILYTINTGIGLIKMIFSPLVGKLDKWAEEDEKTTEDTKEDKGE